MAIENTQESCFEMFQDPNVLGSPDGCSLLPSEEEVKENKFHPEQITRWSNGEIQYEVIWGIQEGLLKIVAEILKNEHIPEADRLSIRTVINQNENILDFWNTKAGDKVSIIPIDKPYYIFAINQSWYRINTQDLSLTKGETKNLYQ